MEMGIAIGLHGWNGNQKPIPEHLSDMIMQLDVISRVNDVLDT